MVNRKKMAIIILALFIVVLLIMLSRKVKKTEEVMNSSERYVNTIPPRIISGTIEEINVNAMTMKLKIATSQLEQIRESELLLLDFTKTVVDHDSDDPTNPTNKSRKKQLKKYSVGQRIYVRLRIDIPVENNTVYVENPEDIY